MNRFGTPFFIILFSIILSSAAFGTTYYSQGNSSPTIISNWNTLTNGTGLNPPNFTSADTFIIQSGHTMTLTGGSWIIDNASSVLQIDGKLIINSNTSLIVQRCQIFSGDTLQINSSAEFMVLNGNVSGADLIVEGSLLNYGNIYYGPGATGEVQTSAKYYHRVDGDTIPPFVWNGAAVCIVDNITTAPTLNGLNQSFRNFVYDCVAQTSIVNFNSQLTNIANQFQVKSTGTGSLVLFNSSINLNVGNVSFNGGTVDFTTTASIFPTITINDTGGIYLFQTAGNIVKTTDLASKGTFNFPIGNRNIQQQGSIGPGAVGYHFFPGSITSIVNDSLDVTGDCIVDSGATLLSGGGLSLPIIGSGNFELKKYGTLSIADINGITTSLALGMVKVTGTRKYSDSAHYIYSALSSQQTGNGLPSIVNTLTINNSSGVALSNPLSVKDSLILTTGQFNTGANTLTIGSVLKLGTGSSIVGTAPVYNSGSTLVYASNGIFLRGLEWSATSGPGYPHHVLISNNTELNLGANGGTTTPHQMAGNLTIELGSKLQMNQTGYIMTQPLTVLGDLNLNGLLILSSLAGNDFYLGGNWLQGDLSSGFFPSGRTVHFIGSTNQTISRANFYSVDFNSLTINKPTGALIIDSVLATSLTIDDTLSLISGDINLKDRSINFQFSTSLLNVSNVQHTIFGSAGSEFQFNTTKTVNSIGGGTLSFNDNVLVTINGSGVHFGNGITTINGVLKIIGGTVAAGGAPIFSSSSTLKYDIDGLYNRGPEWSSLSGAGYPHHVMIIGSTVLNLGFGDNGVARQLAGDLTVESGSELTMNITESQMTASLSVNGNVFIDGTLTLSSFSGGISFWGEIGH